MVSFSFSEIIKYFTSKQIHFSIVSLWKQARELGLYYLYIISDVVCEQGYFINTETVQCEVCPKNTYQPAGNIIYCIYIMDRLQGILIILFDAIDYLFIVFNSYAVYLDTHIAHNLLCCFGTCLI